MYLLKTKKIHPQDLDKLVNRLEEHGFTTKVIRAESSELNDSEIDEHVEFEVYKGNEKILRIRNQSGFIYFHKVSTDDVDALVETLSKFDLVETANTGLPAFLFLVFIVAFIMYLLPIGYAVSDELGAVFLTAFGVVAASFASIELSNLSLSRVSYSLKLACFGLSALVLAPLSFLLIPSVITSLRNQTAVFIQNNDQ